MLAGFRPWCAPHPSTFARDDDVVESLEREIRELRSLYWHPRRDPEGRVFAPLADAYRRAGQHGQALEALEDGLGRIPGFATGHLVSAWLHRDLGDSSRAETSYRQVLELDPGNARALVGLGRLQVAAGRLDAGRELVRRALELDPLLEAEETLPESVTAPPAEPPAAPEVEAVAEVHPEAEEVVLTLDALAPDSGQEADEMILSLDALAPEDEPEEEPEVDAAAADDDEVVLSLEALAPVEVEVEVEEAEAGWGDGDEEVLSLDALAPEEAAPVAQEAVEPADGPLPTRTLAELYARQGLTREALAVYLQLAEASPDDPQVRARIAELRAETDTATDTASESGQDEPEVEDSHHDEHLPAAPEPSPDAPTPFGWAGGATAEEDAEEPKPPVGDYFGALLAWGAGPDAESGSPE